MTIIAASRAHAAVAGTQRHRIVLRNLVGEHVVHTQIGANDSTNFCYGHYFRDPVKARKYFEDRVREFHRRYRAYLEAAE